MGEEATKSQAQVLLLTAPPLSDVTKVAAPLNAELAQLPVPA